MIGSQYSRCKLWLLAVSIFALGCVPNPGRLEGNGNADAAGDMTADSGSADVLADTAVGDGLSDAVIGDSSGTPDGDSVAPPDLDDGSAPDVPPSDDSDDATSVPPDYPEGILGGPPTGPFKVIATVEVRNDTSLIRQREIAFSGIPLAKIDDVRDVAKLILVDAQNRWVQAQFNVLSRWGGALGTISDNSRPIRWLEISLPTSLAANASGTFELREYTANAPLANDPLSAAIVKDGSLYRVTTGVARFTLNPYNPALIELIEVDFGQSGTFSTVYMHKAGAGPRMLTGGGAVVETLASYDTLAVDNTVSVDPSPDDVGSPDFEIVEEGPVKIVVRVRGHFRRPQERRDCTDNNFSDATDPFGFSAALTFYRGSADVGLLFNFRNECGSADPVSFLDEGADVDEVSWVLPLLQPATRLHYQAFTNAGKTADNFQGTVTIAQSKGRIGTTSSKWESDAYISLQPLSSGQTFPERQALLIKPWIAAENDFVRIGVTMPWMRWREPQALVGRHDSLTLGFVSEPLHIGEAKGIWNVARIHIGSATSPVDITTMMSELLNRTQRGLLVRLPLEQLNRTLVFPSLGNGDPKSSKLKQNYRYALEQVHGFMLGYPVSTNPSEPGQWIRGLSFGSQRWPDSLQLSPNNQTITTPYESSPYTNTANPMNSEVKEFFRSGEPKWLWDFALPQAYLMLFTAWYNTGKLQNWINGFAVAVGGTGEGNWHRDGPDYYNHGRTENTGLSDVYVLRPNPLMRDRFLQQGQSAIILFDKGQQLENTRGWVETVALHTGTDDDADSIAGDNFTQHLVALGDCAEFVPGPPGEACLAKMRELMGEIASDNLIDKMPCNGDEKPTGQCTVGSLFVYLYRYALFVWRFVHTFSADDGQVHRDAMVGLSKLLLDAFIPKKSALPDIEGIWSYYAKCDLASGSITSCNAIFGDPWQIYPDEKPQVLALPLIARQLADYAPDPCAYVRLLADDDALYSHWLEAYSSYYAGWIEGNSFFMQAMILAVGGLDECPN